MINRIIAYTFFFCLIIAIPLAIMGIERVEIGPAFLGLMNQTSKDLETFKIAIPEIPNIPYMENQGNAFTDLINGFFWFVNMLIGIINFLSMLINLFISLVEFIVLLIKNVIAFKDTLVSTASSGSSISPISSSATWLPILSVL